MQEFQNKINYNLKLQTKKSIHQLFFFIDYDSFGEKKTKQKMRDDFFLKNI